MNKSSLSLPPPAGQFPLPGSPQIANSSKESTPARKKVMLQPGHSLMDWIRLANSGTDMTGIGGPMYQVSPEELAKHNKEDDIWIAIKGLVYNVTPYMAFHPGGADQLMRAAGADGTTLFNEVHMWVNHESMLQKCFIGKLKGGALPNASKIVAARVPQVRKSSTGSGSSFGSDFAVPAVPQTPRYEWFQNADKIMLVVYTRSRSVEQQHVIIDRRGRVIEVSVILGENIYKVCLELEGETKGNPTVNINRSLGKVEIVLTKEKVIKWGEIGKAQPGNNVLEKIATRGPCYRDLAIESIERVTHDTSLFCLMMPVGARMITPIGGHIYLKCDFLGTEVVRPYTTVLPSLDKEIDKRCQDGTVIYLMIKIYNDGVFTPNLGKANVGDKFSVSNWECSFDETKLTDSSDLILLAAGSGFTPMVRLIHQKIHLEQSDCKVKLMFFNKTIDDILWKSQLDQLAQGHKSFEVHHILSKADDSWLGTRGRIRRELLEPFTALLGSERNVLACACGPRAFTDEAVRLLEELGLKKDQVHAFLS
ncbi:cytochrome b5 reductase 4-like isoform X2 [Lineus longissimus]